MPATHGHTNPHKLLSLLAHSCEGLRNFWVISENSRSPLTIPHNSGFEQCSMLTPPVPRTRCSDRSRRRRALSPVACWEWKLYGGAFGRSQSVLQTLDVDRLPVMEWAKWKKEQCPWGKTGKKSLLTTTEVMFPTIGMKQKRKTQKLLRISQEGLKSINES